MPPIEYVTPVLAAGRPVAFAFVALRFGPDALVRLVAGIVAVLTHDKERGERCLAVLRILRNKDDPYEPPPELEGHRTPATPRREAQGG
jgi:hypothetical protein